MITNKILYTNKHTQTKHIDECVYVYLMCVDDESVCVCVCLCVESVLMFVLMYFYVMYVVYLMCFVRIHDTHHHTTQTLINDISCI